jgi:hypothetical protein
MGVPRDDGAGYGMRATLLFAATGLMIAITAAGIRVAGWRPGSLDNRVEWVFWAGAILGGLGAGLFGVAALPGRNSAREIRIGMGLFLLAPVLCVIAVFGDYWI